MNAIWCLFSIENNYDQPDNNLVTWWSTLPDVAELQLALGKFMGGDEPDKAKLKEVAAALRIKQEEVRLGLHRHSCIVNFRLERIQEGNFPCARN